MLDWEPIEYTITPEDQGGETTSDIIDLYEVLLANGLENYLRELRTIKRDVEYKLPSRNTFKVTYDGIMYTRDGKEELWKIRAEKTWVWVWLHVDRLEYDPNGWKLRVTAKKMWITIKKEQDPQILERSEISQIFGAIEAWNTYTRPTIRPDGKPYELILEVIRS